MSNPTHAAFAALDRNTAHYINPMIGIHAEETLENCTRAVSDLGYIVSAADHSGCEFETGNLFRLFEVITRAMHYEIEAMKKEQA